MEREVQKWQHTSVKHGEGTGRQSTSITDADTAHTVENLKKLNFEVLEHPLYSLDLTPSDSPVWSTDLAFLNMKHTVRIIIDSPSQLFIRVNFWHATGQLYFSVFPTSKVLFLSKDQQILFQLPRHPYEEYQNFVHSTMFFLYTCNSSEILQGRVLRKVVVPFKLLYDRKTFNTFTGRRKTTCFFFARDSNITR